MLSQGRAPQFYVRLRFVASLMLVALTACGLFAQGSSTSLPQVATGAWAPAGMMSTARTGAAAAVMNDGSLLVSGGTDANGNILSTVEIYGANGAFTLAPPMQTARTGHTATWLLSGYVLVTGGATSGGGITNSAEIYDPVAMTWTMLPGMVNARAGHTATALGTGDVLLAGGYNSGGTLDSLEVFSIQSETFSIVGTMSSPRQAQAAAALNDGRVLIVGGTDPNGATLNTTDLYDSIAGTVTQGPNLNTARTAATATTLLHGMVLIAGGSYPEGAAANSNVAELTSAEIFDPVAGTLTPLTATLNYARTGQLAFLLPNNNNLLLDGGTSGGADLPYAELYSPWKQTFSLTASMAAARSQAVGGGLWPLADGLLLVAGGSNLASAELYGFATVETDRLNYEPGATVIVTGSGWQPGETVSLFVRETPACTSPDCQPPSDLSALADANGKIINNTFVIDPDGDEAGTRFYLYATGATSQLQAQTTFIDGSTSLTVSPATGIYGGSTSLSATLTAGGTPIASQTISFALNGVSVGSAKTNALGVATLAKASLAGIGVGTWPNYVGASFAATKSYGAAGGTASLTVTAATVTAAVKGVDKPYDSTTAATVTCTLSGVVGSDSVTCAAATANVGSANVAYTAKGIVTSQVVTATGITLSGAAAGNYQLSSATATTTATITPDTITATVAAADKYYDGTNTASVTSCTPNVLSTDNGNVTCTAAAATFASASVAYDPDNPTTVVAQTVTATGITLSGSAASNYKLSPTTATTTAEINPASLTPTVTANDKAYDLNTTATMNTCTLADGNGKTVSSGVACSASTLTFASASVAYDSNNAVTSQAVAVSGITLSGTKSADYTLTATTGNTTATINPASITATISATDKTYDGTNTEPLSGITCTPKVLAGDPGIVTCSATAATFASANVTHDGSGNVTSQTVTATGITLAGTGSGNYKLSSTQATAQAKINPATLTATVTAKNKSYDSSTTATMNTCTLADSNGNTVSSGVACSASTLTFASANVAYDGSGNVTTQAVAVSGITLSGTTKNDYSLTSTSGTTTATINPATPTVQVTCPSSITYDGNAHDSTLGCTDSATGVGNAAVNGSWSLSGARVTNVGTYTVTGTFTSKDPNYASATGTATMAITPIVLTPVIIGAYSDSKTPSAFSCGLPNGVLPQDQKNLGCTTSYNISFADDMPGTCRAGGVSYHDVALTGSQPTLGNYTIAVQNVQTCIYAMLTAVISPIAPYKTFDKSYDGTANVTVPLASIQCTPVGVLVADQGNITCSVVSASFTDTTCPVTASSPSGCVSTDQNGNIQPQTATAAVTFTFNTTSTLLYWPLNPVSGTSPQQYAATALGYINPVPLTVSATAARFYDEGLSSPITPSYIGLVNQETASVFTTAQTCGAVGADGVTDETQPNAPVGEFPITCTGGVAQNYTFSPTTRGTLLVAGLSTQDQVVSDQGFTVAGTCVPGTCADSNWTINAGTWIFDPANYPGSVHFGTTADIPGMADYSWQFAGWAATPFTDNAQSSSVVVGSDTRNSTNLTSGPSFGPAVFVTGNGTSKAVDSIATGNGVSAYIASCPVYTGCGYYKVVNGVHRALSTDYGCSTDTSKTQPGDVLTLTAYVIDTTHVRLAIFRNGVQLGNSCIDDSSKSAALISGQPGMFGDTTDVNQNVSFTAFTAASNMTVTAIVTAALDANNNPYITNCTPTGILPQDQGLVTCSVAGPVTMAPAKAVGSNPPPPVWVVTAQNVSISGPSAGKYLLANPTATTTLPMPPNPVLAVITANDKYIDGTTTASIATCTVTDLSGNPIVVLDGNGNPIPNAVTCSVAKATFSSAAAGCWKVTGTGIALGGPADGGYYLKSTTASTVSPQPCINLIPIDSLYVGGNSKTYDGNTTAVGLTCDFGIPGLTCTANGNYNDPNVAKANTILFTVTVSGTNADWYDASGTWGVNGAITPRALQVSGCGSAVAGNALSTPSACYSGFVNSENAALNVTVAPTCTSPAAATADYAPGVYPASCSGGTFSSNYSASDGTGNFILGSTIAVADDFSTPATCVPGQPCADSNWSIGTGTWTFDPTSYLNSVHYAPNTDAWQFADWNPSLPQQVPADASGNVPPDTFGNIQAATLMVGTQTYTTDIHFGPALFLSQAAIQNNVPGYYVYCNAGGLCYFRKVLTTGSTVYMSPACGSGYATSAGDMLSVMGSVDPSTNNVTLSLYRNGSLLLCSKATTYSYQDISSPTNQTLTIGQPGIAAYTDTAQYVSLGSFSAAGNMLVTPVVKVSPFVYDPNNPTNTNGTILSCSLNDMNGNPVLAAGNCTIGEATFSSWQIGCWPVTVTGIALDPSVVPYYSLSTTTVTVQACIQGAATPLTATSVTVAAKQYDGTTNATITSCVLQPSGSGQNCIGTAKFADPSVGNAKTVNLSLATTYLTPNIDSVYTLIALPPTTTANITSGSIQPRTLEVTACGSAIAGSPSTPAACYSGFVNSDTAALVVIVPPTCTSTAAAAANYAPGVYPATCSGGSFSSNYSPSYRPGNFILGSTIAVSDNFGTPATCVPGHPCADSNWSIGTGTWTFDPTSYLNSVYYAPNTNAWQFANWNPSLPQVLPDAFGNVQAASLMVGTQPYTAEIHYGPALFLSQPAIQNNVPGYYVYCNAGALCYFRKVLPTGSTVYMSPACGSGYATGAGDMLSVMGSVDPSTNNVTLSLYRNGSLLLCSKATTYSYQDVSSPTNQTLTIGQPGIAAYTDTAQYVSLGSFSAAGNMLVTPVVTVAPLPYNPNNPNNTNGALLTCTLNDMNGNPVLAAGNCTGQATFSSWQIGCWPVTVTGIALDPKVVPDYSLSTTTVTVQGCIQGPATSLTATSVTIADKQYDGTTNATITSCVLQPPGSGQNCIGTAQFADPTAGTAKTVNLSMLTTYLTPNVDSAYTLIAPLPSTTGNIIPIPLTVTVTASNKYYDGNATATITKCTVTGLLPADVGKVTCSVGAASFTDITCDDVNLASMNSNQTAGCVAYSKTSSTTVATQTVTATNITLGGTAAKNYAPPITATTTATIEPVALTVRPCGTAVYSATTSPAPAPCYSGFAAGEGEPLETLDATNNTVVYHIIKHAPTCTAQWTGSGPIPVGIYAATCDLTNLSKAGQAAHNYTLSAATGAFVVASSLANYDNFAFETKLQAGSADSGQTAGNNWSIESGAWSFDPQTASDLDDSTDLPYSNSAHYASLSYFTGNKVSAPIWQIAEWNPNIAGQKFPADQTSTIMVGTDIVVGSTAHSDVYFGPAVLINGLQGYVAACGYETPCILRRLLDNSQVPFLPSTSNCGTSYPGAGVIYTLQSQVVGTNVTLKLYRDGGLLCTAQDLNSTNLSGQPGMAGRAVTTSDTAHYVSFTNFSAGDLRIVTPVLTVANKTYDGTTSASVTCSPQDAVGNILTNLTCSAASAVFSDANVGTGKKVTVTGITLSNQADGSPAGDYEMQYTSTTATGNITAATVTAMITAVNKPWDGTVTEPAGNVTCALTPAIANVTCSATAATFASANVGTGIQVTATGITLGGSGMSNWVLASTSATAAANITPAAITAVVSAANKTFDGTITEPVANISCTLTPAASNLTCAAAAATFASANVGTGIQVTATGITLSGSAAGDYTLGATSAITTANILPATVTASVTATSKVYDGTANEPVTSVACALSPVVSNLSCTVGAATFASVNEASGIVVTATGITLGGSAAGNYALATTSATYTSSITAAPITATVSAINMAYTGGTTEPIANITCTLPNGVSNVTCAGTSAVFANKGPGTGITVTVSGITLSGSGASNYSLTSSTATAVANILPASVTPQITAVGKPYDGTATESLANVTCSLSPVESNLSCAVTAATFASVNTGTGITVTATGITLTGSAASSYALSSTTATSTSSITAAPITATVTAANKAYNGNTTEPIANVTCSLPTGVMNVTCAGTAATFASSGAGTGIVVTVTGITLSGTGATNYSLTSSTATTTANILSTSVTPSITAASKAYDGTTTEPLANVTCTPSPAESNLSCAVGTATFASANKATGITVTATGITLTGSAASSYALSSTTATATASITVAPVTASVTAASKTYNGTNSEPMASVTCSLPGGVINVTCAGTAATFASANVGTGITVTVTGITLSGSGATNYSLTSTTATATANILPISVTASITATSKPYDGSTTEPLANVICSLSPVESNLSCAAGAATFASANAGNGIAVTASGITLTGSAASNYSLASTTATATANITAANITPAVTAGGKTYDGATTEPIANVTCAFTTNVSNVTCTPASAVFASANAGTGITVTASGITLGGSAASNYALTSSSASTTATIAQAPQTIIFPGPAGTSYTFGQQIALSATSSSGLPVSYTVTGPATLSGSTLTVNGGGAISVTANQAGNSNYSAAAPVSNVITIAQLAQTVSFPNPGPLSDLASQVTLAATASSGLPVSYSLNSGPATLSGSALTITGVGTISVTASQAGNSSYAAATPVTVSIAVNNVDVALTAPGNATAGQLITLTATAAQNGTLLQAGSVSFMSGSQLLGTAQLAGSTPAAGFTTGSASLKLRLPPGTYALVAQFSGAESTPAGNSAAQNLTVTGTYQTATGLTSQFDTANSSNYDLTATVFGFGLSPLTGTVNFADITSGTALAPATLSSSTRSFLPQQTYPVNSPVDVASGDFNGDGNLDLAVIDAADKTVNVLLGNGDGTFTPAQTYAAGSNPVAVVVGDFNADGILDLAVADQANGVAILLGNGDGTFQSAQEYPAANPSSLVVGDFNGDGIADLAVGAATGNAITMLLGNGDGTFQAPLALGTGVNPWQVVTGDINGDGNADLVVANNGDGTVSVLLGNGDGTFQPQQAYSVGNGPTALTLKDFDGNGTLDIAVVNMNDNTLSVLPGNGDGTFQPQAIYPVGNQGNTAGQALLATDINGDGKLDLVVTNPASNSVGVLLGNGDGTFQTQQTYAAGNGPGRFVVGDFNADGAADIAVVNSGDNTVEIMLGGMSATATLSNVAVAGIGDPLVTAAFVPATGSLYAPSTSNATSTSNRVVPLLTVTGGSFVYDGTAHAASCSANAGGILVPGSCTFLYAPGGATTPTGVGTYTATATFTPSNALNYASTTGSGSIAITVATPALTLNCSEVTFDGNAHSCTGSATGAGGFTLNGSWSFSPASESTAGSYPVTGTFTSGNSNYVSGGTVTSGTLIIDPATPILLLSCPAALADGNSHSCTGTAAGIGGVAVSGSFSFSPASETSIGSYSVTAIFTSSDPDYNSGIAQGRLILTKAPPSKVIPYMTSVAAKVPYPDDVVVDLNGNVYVNSGGTVFKIDAVSGTQSVFAGGGVKYSSCSGRDTSANGAQDKFNDGCPATSGYLYGTRGLAVDAKYLYLDDGSDKQVHRVGLSDSPLPGQSFAHEMELVAATRDNTSGLAVDAKGNLFWGDGGTVVMANYSTNPPVISTVVSQGSRSCNSEVNGLAFDKDGNLYFVDKGCYSLYKATPNPATGVVDGGGTVSTLVGNGSKGAYQGPWFNTRGTPAFIGTLRSVATAGRDPNTGLSNTDDLYISTTNGMWFFDADTGWAHQIMKSAATANLGCPGNMTWPYTGCPAPNATFEASANVGAHMTVDLYGNLYITDLNSQQVTKVAMGTDFAGTAPAMSVSPQAPVTQMALIHGPGDCTKTTLSATAPFAIGTLSCSPYSVGDQQMDWVVPITYTPTATGEQSGTITVGGTTITLDGNGSN